MKHTRIINYSMVVLYTAGLAALAVLCELALFWAGLPVPATMREIAISVAETGFSVTVIAVSILAVITNMSERRYFGIKAGEYLKFRRRRVTPAFYDVLVIIVLIGTLQYAALAASAIYAAAFFFLEIVTLMIVQVRWGLGIAFFHYGKEREIRRFFQEELAENLADIAVGKGSRRFERANLAVTSRINNLFIHAKRAAAMHENAELEQNLGMLTYVLGVLLDPKYHCVWHNYETRLDSLIASLLHDDELGEYALSALTRVTDIIMNTMHDPDKRDTVAQNCDFDQSRATAYDMVTYAHTRMLRAMFDAQLFYKLAVVKIYGITTDTRKVSRYAHYTDQFAENAAASKNALEVRELVLSGITGLAPYCFENGKPAEAALYVCTLMDALKTHGISLHGLRQMLEEKVHENGDERKQRSVYMLMRTMESTLGMPKALPPQDEASEKTVADLQKLLAAAKEKA